MKVLAATLLAVLLVALVLWQPWRPAPSPPPPPLSPAKSPPPVASGFVPPPDDPGPRHAPRPDPVGLSPDEIQAVRDAIDNLEFVFRDHAIALGGNPVGTNAEITAALRGDNPKQLKLDLPGDSSVNEQGELCDPWGTPWFFHQISGTKMEIRSAGKDRKLYTEDDFVR